MKKRIRVSRNGKCSVSLYCQTCKRRFEIYGLSAEQNERLYERSDTRQIIDEIIPEVPAEWRELLFCHECPDCRKKETKDGNKA